MEKTPFETRYPAKGKIASDGSGMLHDSIAIKRAIPQGPSAVITLSIQFINPCKIVSIIKLSLKIN